MNGSMQQIENGRWRVRWRDPDGRGRSRTFDAKADAKEWLAYVRHKTALAELPLIPRIRVGDWFDDWLEAKQSSVRSSTWIDYESIVRNHVPDSWRHRSLGQVSHSAAQRLIGGLVATGRSGRARKVRAVLSCAFRDAVTEGYCVANPFAAVRIPPEAVESSENGRRALQCPSPQDVWKLAQAVPEWASPLILLAGFAGLRWGEVIALRPVDLDLEASEVHVVRSFDLRTHRFGPPKSASSTRTAVMSVHIRNHLEVALSRSRSELAFESPAGGVVDHSNYRKRVWLPVTAKLGMTGTRFHDLRHTYASTLISSGLNPAVVSTVMGHSSPAVTLRTYARFWQTQLDDAKDALDRATAQERCADTPPSTLYALPSGSEATNEQSL